MVFRLRLFAAAAGLLGSYAINSAAAADIVVGTPGGIWETSVRECIIKPFTAKTGKTVDLVLGSAVQWMNQIAASSGRPPLDAMFVPSDLGFAAINRGVLEKMDEAKVPQLALMQQQFANTTDGYGAVFDYGAMGLLYNKDAVASRPKSWHEFFDGVVAGKWKASIPSINYTVGLATTVWLTSHLYGGDVVNIDPGLTQIRKMVASGNLSFWSDPNEVLNALKSGDVDIAAYWDGRSWAFIDDGNRQFDFYAPKPGGVAAATWITKVKGGSELAWQFIDVALTAEAESCFSTRTFYGTTNRNVVYPANVASKITATDNLLLPPFKDIPPQTARWVEKWNREIGR